jgi:spore coat polysaccharide biosynthesis protein SpsF
MILAILQARFSSSRLPGKVLKPLLGVPMLARQIERVKRTQKIDLLVVATSQERSDDAIELLCTELAVDCFRGSLEDVLDRFYQAAQLYTPKHVVRLTGDCPLSDPELIDRIIEFHLANSFDYTSNTIEPTYPDGLDVEVFRFSCLEQAWQEATIPSQREHVTPFIHQQPDRFQIGSNKQDIDLSDLRWTVDEALDYDLVSRIYEELYQIDPTFGTQEILNFLENNPELKTINTCYMRNEGFQKSLLDDEQYLSNI